MGNAQDRGGLKRVVPMGSTLKNCRREGRNRTQIRAGIRRRTKKKKKWK